MEVGCRRSRWLAVSLPLLSVALAGMACDRSSSGPEDKTAACPCGDPPASSDIEDTEVPQPPLEFAFASGSKRAITVEEMAAIPGGLQTLTVDNPDQGRPQTYRGYWLRDVMAAVDFDPAVASELIFHCADGYAPHHAPDKLAGLQLFLAIGQVGVPGGGRWEKVKIGKDYLSPEPYYIVTRDPASYKQFSWPLQVMTIEAMSRRPEYALAYPQGASEDGPVMHGFRLFKSLCLGCHSMNLQGGSVGPELNVPRSITEYRTPRFLRDFIRTPGSFRARSKMPGYPQLSSTDMDALLAYLGYMKAHQRTQGL